MVRRGEGRSEGLRAWQPQELSAEMWAAPVCTAAAVVSTITPCSLPPYVVRGPLTCSCCENGMSSRHTTSTTASRPSAICGGS